MVTTLDPQWLTLFVCGEPLEKKYRHVRVTDQGEGYLSQDLGTFVPMHIPIRVVAVIEHGKGEDDV